MTDTVTLTMTKVDAGYESAIQHHAYQLTELRKSVANHEKLLLSVKTDKFLSGLFYYETKWEDVVNKTMFSINGRLFIIHDRKLINDKLTLFGHYVKRKHRQVGYDSFICMFRRVVQKLFFVNINGDFHISERDYASLRHFSAFTIENIRRA